MSDFESWLSAYLASVDDAALLSWSSAALLERARADKEAILADVKMFDDDDGPGVIVRLSGNEVILRESGLPESECSRFKTCREDRPPGTGWLTPGAKAGSMPSRSTVT